MDPATAALIVVGAGAGGAITAPATELLKFVAGKIVGPSLDAIGEGMAASLTAWAERRKLLASEMLLQSATMLIEAGVEPQPAPGRILFPLLQYASAEEDEKLRLKWAALLANACSPLTTPSILPAYAELLRQLLPVQAALLDWMHTDLLKDDEVFPFATWHPAGRAEIESRFHLSQAEYPLLISDLERMQLIEPHAEVHSTDSAVDGDELFKLVRLRFTSMAKYDSIRLTVLGLNFLKACTPPAAAAE